jgi:hypothetical protein
MKHVYIRGKLYAVVPLVPTDKMNDAYIEEIFDATDRGEASLEAHKSAYTKMLEAYANE